MYIPLDLCIKLYAPERQLIKVSEPLFDLEGEAKGQIYQFEISTYNTLCSRGPTKVLALSRINIHGGHLVFQNEAKNIPGKILWVRIYPTYLRRLAIIFSVRVVTANNKGGIWPHSLRYHFESF